MKAKVRAGAGVIEPLFSVTLVGVEAAALPEAPSAAFAPPPVRATLFGVNVAVTVIGVLPAMTHAAVPEQPPPLQPLKNDPESAVAVRVMTFPAG